MPQKSNKCPKITFVGCILQNKIQQDLSGQPNIATYYQQQHK